MTDYTELVRKMRTCIGDKKCFEKECRYWSELGCMDGNICCDAADAIEALNRLVDLNTERCEGLRKQLREAQEQYAKNINELEKELNFSKSTYEEFQIVAATQNALLAKKLPKRGEIVRCGECKWLFNDSNTFFKPCEVIIPEKDWYCAYGERREG